MGRMEYTELSAAALGFNAWNEGHGSLGYSSSSSNRCVHENSIICHPSEKDARCPLAPAVASTIVLAKVIPSPASLDLHNSSLSASYRFSPRAGCPVAMCVLQNLASLT